MNKYKLINSTTQEEYLCDKITIDGFDYYVSDEKILTGDYKYHHVTGLRKALVDGNYTNQKKVITTNNPNIDIPKIVDIKLNLTKEFSEQGSWQCPVSFETGYNKSQETHPFSEEDLIEFLNWISKDGYPCNTKKGFWILHPQEPKDFTPKELIQLWKEQQPKTLYYE